MAQGAGIPGTTPTETKSQKQQTRNVVLSPHSSFLSLATISASDHVEHHLDPFQLLEYLQVSSMLLAVVTSMSGPTLVVTSEASWTLLNIVAESQNSDVLIFIKAQHQWSLVPTGPLMPSDSVHCFFTYYALLQRATRMITNLST